MLRIATRSTLIAALLTCGAITSVTPISIMSSADAANRCRQCRSHAGRSAHDAPAPIVHAPASPIVGGAPIVDASHVSAAGLQSAGGYGPAWYGADAIGPGVRGPGGMAYGPVAAAIARKYAPNCRPHTYGNPDLFASYYVPPTCGGGGAQIYPAPGPVPALVGHTYYTYQPFAPHEMLYPHHRTYHRYYNGGRGLTRAKVVWSVGPMQSAKTFIHHFGFAR